MLCCYTNIDTDTHTMSLTQLLTYLHPKTGWWRQSLVAQGQRWICCTQHPHQHQSSCQPLGTCRSGGLGCSTPCRTLTHSIWHLHPYPTIPLTCQMYTPKMCFNTQHLAFTTLPNSSSNISDVHTKKMCLNTWHLAFTTLSNSSSNMSNVHI